MASGDNGKFRKTTTGTPGILHPYCKPGSSALSHSDCRPTGERYDSSATTSSDIAAVGRHRLLRWRHQGAGAVIENVPVPLP